MTPAEGQSLANEMSVLFFALPQTAVDTCADDCHAVWIAAVSWPLQSFWMTYREVRTENQAVRQRTQKEEVAGGEQSGLEGGVQREADDRMLSWLRRGSRSFTGETIGTRAFVKCVVMPA